MQNEEREALAAYAHEAWSGWMKYMFGKSSRGRTSGHVVIPADLVARWERQMTTPYADLPESEKESDRVEADKMLAIIRPTRFTCSGCGGSLLSGSTHGYGYCHG
jgi:hypothetical protein